MAPAFWGFGHVKISSTSFKNGEKSEALLRLSNQGTRVIEERVARTP